MTEPEQDWEQIWVLLLKEGERATECLQGNILFVLTESGFPHE
jgi:hypothetical protein